MAESKILKDAKNIREVQLKQNVYNENNPYGPEHTHALSDDKTPRKGKGTGIPFDFTNGGDLADKNARNSNIKQNTYNKNNPFTGPDN